MCDGFASCRPVATEIHIIVVFINVTNTFFLSTAPKNYFSTANQPDEIQEGPLDDSDRPPEIDSQGDDNSEVTNDVSKNVLHPV